jgi:hypothetical protein
MLHKRWKHNALMPKKTPERRKASRSGLAAQKFTSRDAPDAGVESLQEEPTSDTAEVFTEMSPVGAKTKTPKKTKDVSEPLTPPFGAATQGVSVARWLAGRTCTERSVQQASTPF